METARGSAVATGKVRLPKASEALATRYRVPAAARALALLEFLADQSDPFGVSVIARRVSIPKSSAFSLLLTLEEAGYVRRNEHDQWALTHRLYHAGMRAARNLDILAIAPPILRNLCAKTTLTAHLAIFERDEAVYALKAETVGMVRFDTYPGKPAALHLTAVGRAIAAVLPEDELANLLDGYDFSGGTHRALRTLDEFAKALEDVRSQGFAFEDEEETTGVSCVAAPVTYAEGQSVAAIGVTALAAQIDELTLGSVGKSVIDAAASLSHLLGEHGRLMQR